MITIRFEDPSTYPKGLYDDVTSSLFLFKPLFPNSEIDEIELSSRIDFRLRYSDTRIEQLVVRILETLEQTWMIGYHNTRLLHKNDLDNIGLMLLTPESYFPWIRNVLTELNICDSLQSEVVTKLKEYTGNKHGNRTDMLAFFAPYSLSQTYAKFTLNIGGEICEFALDGAFPDVYEKLTKHGYPVTVEFRFPFSEVVDWRKNTVVVEFLRYYIAKNLFGYDYKIELDGATKTGIPAKDILRILDFVDEWKE